MRYVSRLQAEACRSGDRWGASARERVQMLRGPRRAGMRGDAGTAQLASTTTTVGEVKAEGRSLKSGARLRLSSRKNVRGRRRPDG